MAIKLRRIRLTGDRPNSILRQGLRKEVIAERRGAYYIFAVCLLIPLLLISLSSPSANRNGISQWLSIQQLKQVARCVGCSQRLSVQQMKQILGRGCDEDCYEESAGCAYGGCEYAGQGIYQIEEDVSWGLCDYSEDPPPEGCEEAQGVNVICADIFDHPDPDCTEGDDQYDGWRYIPNWHCCNCTVEG